MSAPARAPGRAADVIVIGGGLVGLACAAALSERGVRVTMLTHVRLGEASPAAAGVLAPSVDRTGGPEMAFSIAARDRFPAYLDMLRERTGITVPLNRLGILEVALGAAHADALRSRADGSRWLDPGDVAALEPALAHHHGARLHADDGAVNNLVLLRALKALLGGDRNVTIVSAAARSLAFSPFAATVTTAADDRYTADAVVVAGGAWAPQLEGLPRLLPVVPVRGQMMSVAGSPVRHVVIGGEGYLVPRGDGRTLVGGTMERVGFDPATTDAGLRSVREAGAAICPVIGTARLLSGWAGLRPMTPDLLPVIGRDPEQPRVLYACGHSRNGILLAPLTGECVARLAVGDAPPFALEPFRADRWPTSVS